MADTVALPRTFRKLGPRDRRRILEELLALAPDEVETTNPGGEIVDLAEVMVESAVGVMPLPLGIASGILIDGEITNIPMATEEPSVIAAATFAGQLVSRSGGGFTTTGTDQIMTAQIAIDGARPGAARAVVAAEQDLTAHIAEILAPMTTRGGGYRGIEVVKNDRADLLVVQLHVDTRDAMGANIINTAAEALRSPLERVTGGTVLMAILTNGSPRRLARAEFTIPVHRIARGTHSGAAIAGRIVRANDFAREDPLRAVTHNKGIMNGISALALATGNDTRAIEAAAHAHAARDGAYRGLTEYQVADEHLHGALEIPIATGVVGSAAGFHPAAGFSLKVLFPDPARPPGAERLGRIAVALGLAQNLAALMALVSDGIQQGHMRRHARRLAWKAGAREEEIQTLADQVWHGGTFNLDAARTLLETLRSGNHHGSDHA